MRRHIFQMSQTVMMNMTLIDGSILMKMTLNSYTIGRKKKPTKEAIAATVENVRGNIGHESGKDDVNIEYEPELNSKRASEHYQDSNNADSLSDDSGEDALNGDKKGKREKIEKFPRYLGLYLDKSNLYVDMKLRDKK